MMVFDNGSFSNNIISWILSLTWAGQVVYLIMGEMAAPATSLLIMYQNNGQCSTTNNIISKSVSHFA